MRSGSLTRLKFGMAECLSVKPSDTKLLSEVSTTKLRVPLERLSEGNVQNIYIYIYICEQMRALIEGWRKHNRLQVYIGDASVNRG